LSEDSQAQGGAADGDAAASSGSEVDAQTSSDLADSDGELPPEQLVPAGPSPISDPPAMVIGTWNLKNFSPYGTHDFRIEDLAAKIEQLAPDVLAVQEIKVKEGSEGQGSQAWDALLGELEGYEGLVNPYNPIDSVVGLLYDPSTVSVVAYKPLFLDDWWPFPRAPLEVTLRVIRDGKQITVKVIVVHLKAFPEGAERRREACEDLDAYLQNGLAQTTLIIGDFNDDPFDTGEDNVFLTSFQEREPTYDFVTADMPLGTVTSLGYQHLVNGVVVDGEFLDHGVATERLHISYADIEPEVISRPLSDYDWYEETYSDHFPVLLHFTP
jgi:endonuclease/exonuclease/phosphatase family metal-dependent hydrolase